MSIQSTLQQKKNAFAETPMPQKTGPNSKNIEKHQNKKPSDEVVLEIGPLHILAAAGVILALVIGLFLLRNQVPSAVTPATFKDSLVNTTASLENSVAKGKDDAPITIVEYSDYECPFCRMHTTGIDPRTGEKGFPVMQQIKNELIDKGEVRYIFKPFVAVSSHNPAFANNAVANFCALEQGKFWEYHDELFLRTRTSGLGIDGKGSQEQSLLDLAGELKLDTGKFVDCYRKRNMDTISRDNSYVMNKIKPAMDAAKQNIGTPLFVVCKTPPAGSLECTGKAFMGAVPYENFKEVIELVKK